jgi:hypothetical protein
MKILQIVLVLITISFFTSCKKDYKCDCVVTDTISGQSSSNEYTTPFSGLNKNEASEKETECTRNNGTKGFTSTNCTWLQK